jgi:hypothetical protein
MEVVMVVAAAETKIDEFLKSGSLVLWGYAMPVMTDAELHELGIELYRRHDELDFDYLQAVEELRRKEQARRKVTIH